MILTQEQKSAIAIGNIQQNVVGIDAQNVNFITNLLTDKLYSNPVQSFLREIVSNAYDSHIEANSDEPVLITLDYVFDGQSKDCNKYEVSIRDYGTGLSPERFNLIYRNIGSSTKRESNDYIGSLGLGRFSALAASSQCTITSYYEGTKDVYMMYKDEGTIHIDKLSSIKTKEHNGLEVSCIIERTYHTRRSLKEGIENLKFFSDIYVNNNTDLEISEDFNWRKIRRFKSFAYCIDKDQTEIGCDEYNRYKDYYVLYGDVLYPIKFPSTTPEYLPEKDLYLRFDIGELDITPSRESLQMTKRTIAAIEQKVKEFELEFSGIIEKEFGDLTDISQIMDIITAPNSTTFYSGFMLKFETLDNKQIYIETNERKQAFNLIKKKTLKLGNQTISNTTLHFLINQILTNRNYGCNAKYKYPLDKRFKNITNVSSDTLLKCKKMFVVKDKTFTPLLRYYVINKEPKQCFVINAADEGTLLNNIRDTISSWGQKTTGIYLSELDLLLKNLKQWYDNKKEIIGKDILPQSTLDAWKALHPPKEKAEKIKVDKDEIVFYGLRPYYETDAKLDKNFVLNFHGTVVVCEKGSPENSYIKRVFMSFPQIINDSLSIRKDRILLCAVAKKNIEMCKSFGFITIDDFMNTETNPIFRKLAAVLLWTKLNNIDLNGVSDLLGNISTGVFLNSFDRQKYLNSLAHNYIYPLSRNTSLQEIIDTCIENNFVDWKFYCKLPSKEELTLLTIQKKWGIMNAAGESGFLLEMMRTKKLPMDFKKFKQLKKTFNECTKSLW